MNQNTRTLLPQWMIACAFGILILFGVGAALLRGDYFLPGVVLGAVAVIVVVALVQRRKSAARFQSSSPDAAVTYYRAEMAKLPHGEQLSAYMCALAFTFYGQYDNARDELTSVSWSGLPPLFEGLRTHALALLAIFRERDFEKAQALAEEARDLCETSKMFPGAATTQRSLEAVVDCCEVLRGSAPQNVTDRLESSIRKLTALGVLLPCWTLARHYAKANPHKADQYLRKLKTSAPHCRALYEGGPSNRKTS